MKSILLLAYTYVQVRVWTNCNGYHKFLCVEYSQFVDGASMLFWRFIDLQSIPYLSCWMISISSILIYDHHDILLYWKSQCRVPLFAQVGKLLSWFLCTLVSWCHDDNTQVHIFTLNVDYDNWTNEIFSRHIHPVHCQVFSIWLAFHYWL